MSKSIRIGWILMLILGVYRVIASILLMVTTQANTGAGINLATTGVAIVFVASTSYRKAEKWSWWFLLVVGIVPLLSCSVQRGIGTWTALGWVIFVLGIIIPVKEILGKKEELREM